MTLSNPLMLELVIPNDRDVDRRMRDFFGTIGWAVRDDTDSPRYTYVHPYVSEGTPATIAYTQSRDVGRIAIFQQHNEDRPSVFARGLRLPYLLDVVEICITVPSDDEVHAIFEKGGELLEQHTHQPPRDHFGAQEFRFSDPFNYSFRVTADPGWEIGPEAHLSHP
jgi:hypothetical protein